MRTLTIMAATTLVLAGCGDAKKGYEDGFNKSFHEKFVASCVSSATRSGADQARAQKLCQCTSDKVAEKYSVSEKMKLKDEQVLPLVRECEAENPS